MSESINNYNLVSQVNDMASLIDISNLSYEEIIPPIPVTDLTALQNYYQNLLIYVCNIRNYSNNFFNNSYPSNTNII